MWITGKITPDIHRKDYATTEDQSGQSGQGAGPEGKDAFFSEYARSTIEAVLILGLRLDGLHPRLDRIQWHGHVPVSPG